MSISKISSIVLYGLVAVSVILLALFYFGNDVAGTEGTRMEEPVITNTILTWAYILGIVSAVFALGFTVVNIFTNAKATKKAAITVGILLVLVLIAYGFASDQLMELGVNYDGPDNNPDTLERVGTGLITMYLLLGVAVVSILYSEVSKYFK